jgi:hypothetical protein
LAAITCGLSFLLTGIYLHLRRLWTARQLRQGESGGEWSPREEDAAVDVTSPDPGAEIRQRAAGAALALATAVREDRRSAAPDLADGSLPLILQRLRRAADSLESMADELVRQGFPAAESPLKHLAGDVEYVFRASRH